MSWHIERTYGFGAAGIRLAAEPYNHPGHSTESLVEMLRDFADAELDPAWRGRAGVVLVATLALVALTLAAPDRDRIAVSEVEVALFNTARPIPIPVPEPEPATPPPPRVVPKPPPPPVPVAEPAPKPPPPPPPPKPVAKPVVKPPPRPVAPPPPAPPRAVPAPPAPSLMARPAPPRRAPARPAQPKPPRIDPLLAPVAPTTAPSAFEVARTTRSVPTRATSRPRLDVAPVSAVAAPQAPTAAAPAASGRAVRRAAPTSKRKASLSQKAIALAGIDGAPVPPPAKRAVVEARTARPELEPATSRGRKPSERNRLVGVSLGSLASCVSDRDEDRLKRRVIATLAGPSQCESNAGQFRFVETKNLNAFLMWIERAASRRETDRCGELQLALDCLNNGTLTEARR